MEAALAGAWLKPPPRGQPGRRAPLGDRRQLQQLVAAEQLALVGGADRQQGGINERLAAQQGLGQGLDGAAPLQQQQAEILEQGMEGAIAGLEFEPG